MKNAPKIMAMVAEINKAAEEIETLNAILEMEQSLDPEDQMDWRDQIATVIKTMAHVHSHQMTVLTYLVEMQQESLPWYMKEGAALPNPFA
jgi:oligoendopeptidase F